eukprot:13142804-Heterocapsa_arctica.AAC.1
MTSATTTRSTLTFGVTGRGRRRVGSFAARPSAAVGRGGGAARGREAEPRATARRGLTRTAEEAV